MSDPTVTIREVERLLRQAGISDQAIGTRRKKVRPQRHPVVRALIRLRNRLLVLLLCLIVALSGLLRWSTTTASEPYLQPVTGRVGDMLSLPPNPNPSDPRFGVVDAVAAPQQAAALPLGWERMVFWWRNIQPDGADGWNAFATDHDAGVAIARAAGRQIVGELIGTPDWAAADPAGHAHAVPAGLYRPYDDSENTWGRFVTRIAARYAGTIDDWIIWNEVNIPKGSRWHTWDGTAADYARLVKVASLAAKAANPHARIILAGDPYFYDHGALFRSLLRTFAEDPQSKSHGSYFDAVDLHLYGRPGETAEIVPQYRAAMARAGIAKPIWIAETNAPPVDSAVSSHRTGSAVASLDEQASFVVQALAIDLASGVARVAINGMIDPAALSQADDPLGLLRADASPRPAYFAYHAVATLFAWVNGGSYRPNSHGVDMVVLHRPGTRITVLWARGPASIGTSIQALGERARIYDKYGQGRLVRARHGRYAITLQGATARAYTVRHGDYVIGGSPLIVVESD